jgi:hypothetical protein
LDPNELGMSQQDIEYSLNQLKDNFAAAASSASSGGGGGGSTNVQPEADYLMSGSGITPAVSSTTASGALSLSTSSLALMTATLVNDPLLQYQRSLSAMNSSSTTTTSSTTVTSNNNIQYAPSTLTRRISSFRNMLSRDDSLINLAMLPEMNDVVSGGDNSNANNNNNNSNLSGSNNNLGSNSSCWTPSSSNNNMASSFSTMFSRDNSLLNMDFLAPAGSSNSDAAVSSKTLPTTTATTSADNSGGWDFIDFPS